MKNMFLGFGSLLLATALVACPQPQPPTTTAPSNPTNFIATATSSSVINLSWAASNGASSYSVERKTGTNAFVTIVASQTSTSYADSGLTASTAYTYRVKASNSSGSSSGATTSATTQATSNPVTNPPANPTNLTVAATSSSAIDLSWTAASGASSYSIERKTGSNAYSSIVASQASTTFSDSGLAANTLYTYRVKASNTIGSSSGVEQSATTQTISGTPPADPTNFTATAISSSAINLSWTASSGATSYKVVRQEGASSTVVATSEPSTTFADSGLSANTTYTYLVQARNASGQSNDVQATATTPGNPPPAVTGLTATVVSTSSIDLTWNAANGADGYRVFRQLGNITTVLAIFQTGTSITDTGLAAGTTYRYSVESINNFGRTTSPEVMATTSGNAPANPTNVTATAVSSSQIDLSWTGSSGASSYIVEFISLPRPIAVAINSPLATSYQVTGLTANTSYSYRVKASNSSGTSSGVVVSATTQSAPQPPANPTGFAATYVGITHTKLEWNVSSGATGYVLRRKIGSGTYQVVATGNGLFYDDYGVSAGTTYTYQIIATNADGSSSGVEISVTTAAVPSSLVGWFANLSSFGGIGYRFYADGTYVYTAQVNIGGGCYVKTLSHAGRFNVTASSQIVLYMDVAEEKIDNCGSITITPQPLGFLIYDAVIYTNGLSLNDGQNGTFNFYQRQ